MITVRTKAELKSAIKAGNQEITVVGDLAKKLAKAATIKSKLPGLKTKFGNKTPTTGMLVGTLAGVDIAIILAVIFIGLGFLILITKDYDLDVKLEGEPPKVNLTKKKSA